MVEGRGGMNTADTAVFWKTRRMLVPLPLSAALCCDTLICTACNCPMSPYAAACCAQALLSGRPGCAGGGAGRHEPHHLAAAVCAAERRPGRCVVHARV